MGHIEVSAVMDETSMAIDGAHRRCKQSWTKLLGYSEVHTTALHRILLSCCYDAFKPQASIYTPAEFISLVSSMQSCSALWML